MFKASLHAAVLFALPALFMALPVSAAQSPVHPTIVRTAPHQAAAIVPDRGVVFPSGEYLITYYNTSGSETAEQCLYSTSDPPFGTDSGYWYATSFSGFGGNWIVEGKDLRFYGGYGYSSSAGTYSGYVTQQGKIAKKGVKTKGYGFDDFSDTLYASNDGTYTLESDASCDDHVVRHHGVDPTR